MGNSQLISVIIPVYKVERYLDKCVQSVCDQTYKNLEIILVDDGSPDKCPKMCDAWVVKDSRIKVIHKQNGGLSDARNAGMAAATGTLIGFVDSDDYISNDMYELLDKALEETDSDIAMCSVQMLWDNGDSRMLTRPENKTLDNISAMKAIVNNNITPVVWNKLYKRDVVAGILFEVGKYHEDVFWSYQIIGNAKKMAIIPNTGYYYLQRTESIMGETYSLKRLDGLEAKFNRIQYLRDNYPQLLIDGKRDFIFSCMYQGQQALREKSFAEKGKTIDIIKNYIKNAEITKADFKNESSTHKIWIHLALMNFKLACKVRNAIGIGV